MSEVEDKQPEDNSFSELLSGSPQENPADLIKPNENKKAVFSENDLKYDNLRQVQVDFDKQNAIILSSIAVHATMVSYLYQRYRACKKHNEKSKCRIELDQFVTSSSPNNATQITDAGYETFNIKKDLLLMLFTFLTFRFELTSIACSLPYQNFLGCTSLNGGLYGMCPDEFRKLATCIYTVMENKGNNKE